MPYATNIDLPIPVQRHLPEHGQEIFREAFNHAWQQYADDPRREEIAHRVAWAAVKKAYMKVGTEWVPRQLVRQPVSLGCKENVERNFGASAGIRRWS